MSQQPLDPQDSSSPSADATIFVKAAARHGWTGPLLNTPAGVFALAGFAPRALAIVIDAFVLAIPYILLGLLARFSQPSTALFFALAAPVLSTLLSGFYYVSMVDARGQTIGKRALGLKVIKADGTQPDKRTSFVRYLIPLSVSTFNLAVTLWPILFPGNSPAVPFYYYYLFAGVMAAPFGGVVQLLSVVDVVYAFFDPRKQALHDKLAGTFVVRVG